MTAPKPVTMEELGALAEKVEAAGIRVKPRERAAITCACGETTTVFLDKFRSKRGEIVYDGDCSRCNGELRMIYSNKVRAAEGAAPTKHGECGCAECLDTNGNSIRIDEVKGGGA